MLITKRLSRLRCILINRERCSPFRTNIKKASRTGGFSYCADKSSSTYAGTNSEALP